jgi:hypothetical protein
MACLLFESVLHGYRSVAIENDLISVTILPEKGAEIWSLIYKPRSMDVLWKAPWTARRRTVFSGVAECGSEAAWMDGYGGGWQEIFPNGGNACVYQGAPLGFHGEASVCAWDYTVRRATDTAISVEFTVNLARSPFTLRRIMTIESGRPALLVSETISNEGEQDLHYMWGHHPALGAPFLGPSCRLQIPASSYRADETGAPTSRIAAGIRGDWPRLIGKAGAPVDLSVLPQSSERVAEFGYIGDIDQGWYRVYSTEHSFGFGFSWPLEIFRYLWFWQELRGSLGYPWYGRCYVMALEPFTSIPGLGLNRAIAEGTAPLLPHGGRITAELAAVFFEQPGDIDSISQDGTVRFSPGSERG